MLQKIKKKYEKYKRNLGMGTNDSDNDSDNSERKENIKEI